MLYVDNSWKVYNNCRDFVKKMFLAFDYQVILCPVKGRNFITMLLCMKGRLQKTKYSGSLKQWNSVNNFELLSMVYTLYMYVQMYITLW